jgi:sulfite exporter TauE/SafE
MDLAAVNSPAAAFAAGLVTSLHCAGMCGPLACMLLPVRGDRADASTVSSVYHLSRLSSYAVLGGVAGGLGSLPLAWISQSALRWIPWIGVLFFVALALRWERHLPKIPGLGLLLVRVQAWARQRSSTTVAAVMGGATPLLPCGPLYILLGMTLFAGSALKGVEFMLAFGLGTVPLLWLAQTQFQWVRQKLSPLWLGRLRIALGLTTALVISWRLRATLGFEGPDPASLICF